MRRIIVLTFAALAACAKPKAEADSTKALVSVDTVKPDSVGMSLTARDSAAIKASTTQKGAPTTTKSTKRVSSRDTAHLGRDSVIRTDPRDPRRQLPTVPRKPPQ